MMIKRIFRSMLLVSAIVLALGFAMTMVILYQYFGGELKQQMKKEAEYLAAGVEMLIPGDNIDMTIELITPIAIETGLRFAIREGGRTVGSGVVSEVIE